jgi:hypothetical protein
MKRGNRKNRAVLVNSNKFSWLQGELYSLRRQVASECVQLDVFGSGWQKSKLRTFVEALKEFVRAIPMIARLRLFDHNRYLSRQPLAYFGRVDDKIQKCSEYKVALVIENSLEMLTEKIHDAWFAGCIPVYVGPDLSDRGIPGDLYFSSEPVSDSILETISRVIHEVDHAEFCKKVDQWIRSSDYSRLFGYVPGWGRALDVGSG